MKLVMPPGTCSLIQRNWRQGGRVRSASMIRVGACHLFESEAHSAPAYGRLKLHACQIRAGGRRRRGLRCDVHNAMRQQTLYAQLQTVARQTVCNAWRTVSLRATEGFHTAGKQVSPSHHPTKCNETLHLQLTREALYYYLFPSLQRQDRSSAHTAEKYHPYLVLLCKTCTVVNCVLLSLHVSLLCPRVHKLLATA